MGLKAFGPLGKVYFLQTNPYYGREFYQYQRKDKVWG
jgi:hypothetical protein